MADVDKSSKTEPPTEKKLSEARSKGQFAKAPEIGMSFTLLAGLLVILFFAPGKALELSLFTKSILENLESITLNQEGVTSTLSESYFSMAAIVIPLLVCCFFAALIAEGLQTGFRYTPKVINPDLNKFNPVNGAKRIFGPKGLKAFLIDFLKFLGIGTVVWLTLLVFLDDPIFYAPIPLQHVPQFIYELFVVMFTILVLMLTIIAIIHFIIKKKEHEEEMKMTNETRKILNISDLKLSSTCVRVPILRAHSESVNIEFEDIIQPSNAIDSLKKADGVEIIEDYENNRFPMPNDVMGRDNIAVGRVRTDISNPNGLELWLCGDQIRKGAALNAVQIAELLIAKNDR